MATGQYNIRAKINEDFRAKIRWLDPKGFPRALGGFKGEMYIRERLGGAILTKLTTENLRLVFDTGETGAFVIDIPREEMRRLRIGHFKYDVVLIDSANRAYCIMEGDFSINDAITYDRLGVNYELNTFVE